MGKVILTCGKICSGKSYYSTQLKEKLNAVIISPDEATYELLNNEQGEFYDIFSKRLSKYLTRKVGEIVQAGANVVFERGLWSRKDRKQIKEYYNSIGVECEIHYVCVDDAGGFLKHIAALRGFCGNEIRDFTLAYHGIAVSAEAGVHEYFVYVTKPDRFPVDFI